MSSLPLLARRALLLLAALLPAAGCAGQYRESVSPAVPAEAPRLTRAQREAIIEALDRTIRRDFAHWEGAAGLDYARHLEAYRTDALATGDRLTFDLLTLRFLAALGNAHTDFSDDWLWRGHGAPLGFRLRWMEGRWAVTASRVPGIAVGDVVTEIDDEPFEAFYLRQRRYVAASSDRGARYLFPSRTYLFPPRFTLGLASGARVAVERGSRPSAAPGDASHAAMVAHRWVVPDSVGYLRIPCFNRRAYEEQALELLRGEYRRASGVVLDVRGNCGGSSPTALVTALADRPFPWWAQYDAVSGGSLIPFLWHVNRSELDAQGRPLPQRPGRALERRPGRELRQRLVLLVDEGCASACEDFVMPLQWIGRALVVGDTTFGSSGQPTLLQLGRGMTARVSTRREFLPDGTPFEGIGLAPDVVVPATLSALRSGRDVALEVAVEELRGGTRHALRAPRAAAGTRRGGGLR